ncbi:MAG: 16S rRNA (adenine(1518)-N(6)/adenine(1519)-N(6))-dimethyltransferase RsmA [Bacteroidota bacterium]
MHNLKPKKYLGQHFLTDQNTALRIVEALTAGAEAEVVEIGPGQGVLTTHLYQKYPRFSVVEVDPDAVAYLEKAFANPPLSIIHQDVLKWQPKDHLSPDSFFIGNLPYNISSPFFFHMLDNLTYIKEGVFMIQKEVAERICAEKGKKIYGILSVLMGAYFDLSYEFSVPPSVFRPPPKVMSGVIRIVRKDAFPEVPFSSLKRVVKAGFNQRRKTLRNALKSLPLADFPEKEFYFTQRAEQLSVDDFVKIAGALES